MHRRFHPSASASAIVAVVRVLAAWGAASAAAPAVAKADAAGAMKGRIVISDKEFGTGYRSDAELLGAIRKQSKSVLKGDGTWTMNLMVFLNEPAGATSINIVYYLSLIHI